MPEVQFTGVRIPYSDLTGTLDPHKVYETRAHLQATQSKNGLERFAYLVFGPTMMASLALALDPYSRYHFPTMRVTPVNRLQSFVSIGQERRFNNTSVIHRLCRNEPDGDPSFPIEHRGPIFCETDTSINPMVESYPQPFVNGFIADTTVRTRPLNSKGGEFEYFAPKIKCPSRANFALWDSKIEVFPDYPDAAFRQYRKEEFRSYSRTYGSWAWWSTAQLDTMRQYESAQFSELVTKHGHGLLSDSLPTSRAFTLTRSLAELKDLPMMYRNLLQIYKSDPKLRTVKGLGGQYLNFKFGWETLVKDIKTMLSIPEQISKEVNRLIDRNGLPSTFRAKRKGIDNGGAIPIGNVDWLPGETYVDSGWTSRRTWLLRTAVTYTLKFPNVDIPLLRSDLINQKWGANPTPADIYNLVPWTWLVDWFGGLSSYVDLMNELANDHSLFNFGYLTYVSNGSHNGSLTTSRYNESSIATIDPTTAYHTDSVTRFEASYELSYKYQKRIDITTLDRVTALSRPTTLSGGQLAIIGALLTKFTAN